MNFVKKLALLFFVPLLISDIAEAHEYVDTTTEQSQQYDYYRESMQEGIEALPECIRGYLTEEGWTIYLVDGSLNHYFNDGAEYCGVTHFYEKWIKIRTNPFSFSSYRNNIYDYTIIHEVGHAVDAMNGGDFRLSETPEFISIWKTEGEKGEYSLSMHNNLNYEYFADCFKEYYADTEIFKARCPMSYEYIDNLIQYMEHRYE